MWAKVRFKVMNKEKLKDYVKRFAVEKFNKTEEEMHYNF